MSWARQCVSFPKREEYLARLTVKNANREHSGFFPKTVKFWVGTIKRLGSNEGWGCVSRFPLFPWSCISAGTICLILTCAATGMSVSPMSPSGLPGFPGLARISGQDVVCSPIATEQPVAAVSWLSPLQPHPAPAVCTGSALGSPGGDMTGTYSSFLERSALTVPPG